MNWPFYILLALLALILGCHSKATSSAPANVAATNLEDRISQTAECTPMSICELTVNAKAVIKADVVGIGSMTVHGFDQDFYLPDGGAERMSSAQRFTSVSVANVQVVRGSLVSIPGQLLVSGAVDQNGRSKNGPLKGASGGTLTVYFFVNDYFGRLPLYALGCGGHFWSESTADGGTTVGSVLAEAPARAPRLSEAAFVAEVDRYWGAKACPAPTGGTGP